MPTAEYHCTSCGQEYEYQFSVNEWPYPDSFSCVSCGAPTIRYFSAAPAMSPDPHWQGYFDLQLGRYISSRDEKRRLLKEKGLEEVSAEEHSRRMAGVTEKDDVIPPNDPKLREAMEKAYADTVAGNIEPVTPRKVDVSDFSVVS